MTIPEQLWTPPLLPHHFPTIPFQHKTGCKPSTELAALAQGWVEIPWPRRRQTHTVDATYTSGTPEELLHSNYIGSPLQQDSFA